MAYEKHTWMNGEAITKAKMQHIEDGIQDASTEISSANTAIDTINNTLNNSTDGISVRMNQLAELVETFDDRISSASSAASSATQAAIAGTSAYQEVMASHTPEGTQDHYATLNARLTAMSSATTGVSNRVSNLETAQTNINTNITGIQTEINAAHRSGVQNDSLALRFASIEGVNSDQATAINNLDTQLNTTLRDSTAQGTTYTTLDARLEASEAELVAARTNIAGYTSSGTQTFASVDARIEAIETEILNARNNKTNLDSYLDDLAAGISSATDLADTKIDKVNIRNELTVTDEGYVLDARQGKALKDLITAMGSAYTSADEVLAASISALETQLTSADTNLDSRITAVSSRLTTAENDIDAIEVELGEGFSSTNTVADNISSINTALTSKASTSDVEALTSALTEKASATDLSNLTTRVTTLEGKDTIVIGKASITYDETTGKPTSIGSTPTANADYLLQNADDKYYYWRYINNNWELISGGESSSSGGGGGNTSGMDLTTAQYEALEEYAVNTDYYVTDTDGRVHHYRYVNNGNTLEEIEIGTPISKKYNISIETIENEGISINYLNLYEFDYDEDDIITDDTDISTLVSKRKRHLLLPATGGGGGAVNTMKITPITARTSYKAFNSNNPVYMRFFFTTGEQGEGASYIFSVDGVNVLDQPINITSGNPANKAYTWPTDDGEELTPEAAALLGFYQFDVNSYCTAMGSHTVKLTIMLDSNTAITAEYTWTITTFNLSIASVFDNNPIVDVGSNLSFTYIPTGNIEKIAHFKIDGTQIGTVPLSAKINTTQTYLIPAQTAGAHKLEAYLTANSGAIVSASIYRDIIWRDSSSSDIIIASPYRGNTERIQQYDVLAIPYTVVGGTGASYTVKYYVDDFTTSVNEVTLTNTNAGQWNYRADASGNHTLRIECGTAHIDIDLIISPLNIDIAPVTNNLILDFNPEGITNTSSRRLWTNGTYHLTVSDNFDWYNGGYGNDINGDYFLVKAGTRATFDYKMFKSYHKTVDNVLTTSSTVFRDGAEMKIVFKTSAVRNADATWFSNVGPTNDTSAAKNVGIQLNVHNGWLMTDAADKDNTKSYLYFPYSEEDRIELDININPETAPNAVYAMSYEDGCPSRAYPYDNVEALYQIENDESPITIGSDDCDVYIYRMRIYNTALNTEDVLRNFIADGKDTNERLERYERNSIYYDTQNDEYTPYQGQDIVLDPERLAKKIPDVKILMLDTPRFTTNKKDFVAYSTLRCIHADGGKVYPSRGKEDNWFFGNGYHAGQGTTSDKYGDAGRNIDFLFECDGIHNPSDKVKPDEGFIPGYRSYVIKGYGMQDSQGHSLAEDPQYCLDWKDEDTWKANTEYAADDLVRANGQVYECSTAHTSSETFDDTNWTLLEGYTNKISLTSTSIPNNFFNLKVNIASSENVNNALFQKRYNDYLPYLSPAYLRDNKIKNDMEFVPAILFLRENDTEYTEETYTDARTGEVKTKRTYTNHNEFNDTEWHFYALGNIGDSKKTDYTRAYDPTDMNEFTLEISDNNTNNSQFQSGVYMKNGVRTIEGYTVEQDYDEDKGKYKDTYSAHSSENEITVETTDYLFPIDYATEWAALDGNNNPVNMRYWSLMNEKFDGDHSFEMRYACEGNYRDGKLVNDTHGKITVNGTQQSVDKWQLELNSNVWREFYTWLITCTDEQFVDELELWCVKSSVAFFYAFTHYYTMIDNRAKNTFWHFAKTGTRRAVPIGRAAPGLLHIYEESDGNGGYQAATGAFDNTKQYYTQYAFDMWVYDCDTAAGIDNNGELIFPYGKEDTDYRVDGDPSSGAVFNGAGSIFWARLRQNFTGDITAAFTGVSTECFNATHLINQFDKFQNCYPESIWRLDVERKYIRSFTGDTGATDDNPQQPVYLTRQNTRFLGDMMQGRKKYQRRQWIKDQGVYFGSKYMLSNMNNQFDMVCYTIGGQNVLPNWDLTITPYQDMYINVEYGETAIRGRRAKAGVPIEVRCPFSSMNESRVRIYGADYIQALAGKPIKDGQGNIIGAESLASLYFRGNDFNHTNKLRELIIGSPDTTYNNSQFNTLNINPNSPILEVLDIQNCGGLTGTLSLNGSTALKRIEAQGTSLTSISLPSSTGIETLHLPSTVNNIILTSAKNLNTITIKTREGVDNVDNLTTLIVNDSDYSSLINWISIANQALSHLTNLQLLELNHSSIVDINALEPFKLRKETLGNMTSESGEEVSRINLSGTISVTGDWSTVEKTNYETVWPHLTLDVSQGTHVNKTKVTYMNRSYISDTGIVPESEIMSTYVTADNTANNIISDIYAGYAPADLPKRDPTIENVFQFGSLTQLGAYRTYSGWTLDRDGANPLPLSNDYNNNNPLRADANTEEITLYTLFNATKHEYTVNWYLEPGKLIKSVAQQQYGDGYELQAPTVREVKALYDTATCIFNSNNTVTYSIFDGWEKLPTNITPTLADAQTSTYNIYGKWYTNTISIDDNADNGLFNDTTNPSLEQLWVLSKMSSTNRNSHTKSKTIVKNKKFSYEMGYSGTVNGTTFVTTDQAQIFDEDSMISSFSSIKPFSTNNGFTLAIDYQLDSEQPEATNGQILVGCYDKVNGSVVGFALYNNMNNNYGSLGPVVGYGNMFSNNRTNAAVGPSGCRNMVVIRHPANSSTLWIYSSRDTNSTSLNNNITVDQISLATQVLSENAVLCLGHLRSDIFSNNTFTSESINTTGAYGTIYWGKYWSEDLGDGECRQLANWPHEKMTSIIASINDDYPTERLTPTIYLTNLNGSSHGIVQCNRFSSSGEGWATSNLKSICDNRIFDGLPTRLQSILSPTRVGYRNYVTTINTNDFGEQIISYSLSELDSAQGYVYLPSISSLTKSSVDQYKIESLLERNHIATGSNLNQEITPYTWHNDSASMLVYDYDINTTGYWKLQDGINSNYYNLRFTNKPISWSTSSKLRIYRISRNSIQNNTTLFNLLASQNIHSGDIVVLTNDAAYMYVSSEDLAEGLNTEPQENIFNTQDSGGSFRGSWIRSQSYATRSASASSSTYNNFIYINALGSPIIPDNSGNQPGLINLNYAFTI